MCGIFIGLCHRECEQHLPAVGKKIIKNYLKIQLNDCDCVLNSLNLIKIFLSFLSLYCSYAVRLIYSRESQRDTRRLHKIGNAQYFSSLRSNSSCF